MWATEPSWGPSALTQVNCPVWIVDGDHDISVQRNQADAMAAWIPFAGQLILPHVGHAALLEDWKFFNFAVEYFLDMGFERELPYY
jgi:pimeloyl-ACP methyl ester carboxylesterase